MDRSYDWMTNRFVQDFANVGINNLNMNSQNLAVEGLNVNSQNPVNEGDLFVVGNEEFNVDSIITDNSIDSGRISLEGVNVNNNNIGCDFDNDVNTRKLKTDTTGVKQEGESNFALPLKNGESFSAKLGISPNYKRSPNQDIKSDFETVNTNDLDSCVNSGLDRVSSSLNNPNPEGNHKENGNIIVNSAQNFLSPDTTEDLLSFKKRDQKRRPKPKDGTSLFCAICGDRALGYNFDAITCESCKAFFRRNALKTKVFACSFEGNCKLDPHTRKFCSGCRLKKCFEVGMKKDWILSDEQLAKRRKKSRSSEEKYHIPLESYSQAPQQLSPQSSEFSRVTQYPIQNTDIVNNTPGLPTSSNGSDGEVTTSYLSDSTENSLNSPGNNPFSFSPSHVKVEPSAEEGPRPMPPDIEAEIAALEKEYKSVFDSGYSELQAKKMVERPHTANELFNMTDIFIRRLIKFAKHIPEFKCLKQEDQIFLLKGGIMEIMVLRSAMGFDPHKLQWKIKQMENVTEHGVDPRIIKEQLGQGMYSNHMKFVTSLHNLTNSNGTVMTLLFVIQIFSPERPNIVSKAEILHAQEKFTMWLRVYMESIMPVAEARNVYPKLLSKMSEVQQLGESSSKLASNLDITKLEPLLVEVFNLQK